MAIPPSTNTLRDVTDPERAKVRTQAKTYIVAGVLLAIAAVVTTRAAYASGPHAAHSHRHCRATMPASRPRRG